MVGVVLMMWLWQWQCEPGYEYINNISGDNNNNDVGSCNNEKKSLFGEESIFFNRKSNSQILFSWFWK